VDAKTPTRAERVALGALIFAVVAPACYVAQRLYEIARVGRVDPSLILRMSHVDYLWRATIACWFAGVCACLAVVAAPAIRARSIAIASVTIGAVVLCLAFVLP
jgi:hypothetical protein